MERTVPLTGLKRKHFKMLILFFKCSLADEWGKLSVVGTFEQPSHHQPPDNLKKPTRGFRRRPGSIPERGEQNVWASPGADEQTESGGVVLHSTVQPGPLRCYFCTIKSQKEHLRNSVASYLGGGNAHCWLNGINDLGAAGGQIKYNP